MYMKKSELLDKKYFFLILWQKQVFMSSKVSEMRDSIIDIPYLT